MDDALKVIKSLLTTSSDGGMLVNEITKEYKEMVGKPIPFREHGFATLTDFLRSTNQFSGTKTANGIKVTIKIPGKSAHIIAMRQKQNVSQAERKRRKKAIMKCGIGGASPSQQPKRSISSQVMKRNCGAISKQRTRAQPQRIANRNLTVKPVVPSQSMTASAQTSNLNKPPVSAATRPNESLQKQNLHDRFVPKQFPEPTVPNPATVTSPIQFHCKSPQTPPSSPPPSSEERSSRSRLLARLAPKQIIPSNDSRKNSNTSDTFFHKIAALSDRSGGRPSRSQLLAQQSSKPPSSLATILTGRAALQKIYQNNENQKNDNSSENTTSLGGTQLQMNQGNTTSDHNKQKRRATAPLGKTMSRNDLYARLAPKAIESKNETKLVGGNSVCTGIKSSTNAVQNNTLNQTNKKTDISSRLQPKQIGTESSELQQINQKVKNNFYFAFARI